MASTDPSTGLPIAVGAVAGKRFSYLVPDWVRVREEDFGLLFYDTRSTTLTFVRSGRELIAPAFAGPRRVLGVRGADDSRSPAISRLLQNLLAKDLVVAEAE